MVQPPALRISARVRPVWAPYEVEAGLTLLPENVPVSMAESHRTLLAHFNTVELEIGLCGLA